ncbi:NmrA-like family protein [Penicillium canescens]|uniref:NmrA-like family protein n=1 Tax=Penicillium canescens TaxID=5083 RepID=UPI0026E02EBC|nr:NmrA-like family protein [Penicillium canescens]KAJ6039649.1 NmrA-like family protein [Penicillium canescens]KAJ6068002.1 NmrA-like family protein [Penicillium canescens]
MASLLVVLGITGNQGGSVADAFVTDKNWRIRAITRDTTSPSAQNWASRGVELVCADMDDIDSLKAAFAGAQAIFAMTDYWSPLSDPKIRAKATERGISANQLCAELEAQRGKNMAIAAASSKVQQTLKRYIYSSLPDVSRLSSGKYTHVWHFDSKAAVERFIREDMDMVEAGLAEKASFIHVGLYSDNWMRSGLEIQKDHSTGGYWHIDIGTGHRKQPFVWARRDTGPLVKRLIEDVIPGTRLLAVSQNASYRDFMAIWAKTLGKSLAGDDGIKQMHDEGYRKLISGDEHLKEHILQYGQYAREFGYDSGDTDTLYPIDIGAEDLVTSLEMYFKQEDWSMLPL